MWLLYITSVLLYIASYLRGYEPCWMLVSKREANKWDKLYCTDLCISTIILLQDVKWNRDKCYCQCECSFHGKSHTYHNEWCSTKYWVCYTGCIIKDLSSSAHSSVVWEHIEVQRALGWWCEDERLVRPKLSDKSRGISLEGDLVMMRSQLDLSWARESKGRD